MSPSKTNELFGQVGSVLVELTIATPVLFLLLLATIDVGRVLYVREQLTSMSREAGNLVLRRCIQEEGLIDSPTLQACVDGALGNLLASQRPGNAPYDVLLTVYRCADHQCVDIADGSTCEPTDAGRCECRCGAPGELWATASSSAAVHSQYNAESINVAASPTNQMLNIRGALAIAEITVDYDRLTYVFPGSQAYEFSIY